MDLLIKGGTVIDGTGTPGRQADVGVDGGRVVAVGTVSEPADRVVDASGLVVSPGFIDVHVHYDAQVLWDPSLAPSTLHGVTTMLGGNCGFTLGQAGPEHAEYLVELLARVEGIPLATLKTAVDWSWHDTAGYLDRIDGRVTPNIGFLAGHSAIRRQVMGERSIGETATEGDVAAMADALRNALAAGALGFSSSNAATHNDGAGDPVPSRFANERELFALARVVSEFPGTTIEYIPVRAADEMARMAGLSLAAQRPVNWNILTVGSARHADFTSDLAASDYAASLGGVVRALTLPARSDQRLNLASGFIFDALPGWDQFFKLSIAERIRALHDPAMRDSLRKGAILGGARRAETTDWANHLICQTFDPRNDGLAGRTVGEVAKERGADPLDTFFDIAIVDELKTVVLPPATGTDDASWKYRAEVWQDSRTLLGASDAGAHMDMLATFSYATMLLSEGVRERQLLPLEEAIRLMTAWPAAHFGLRDRGRLAEGGFADIVVFDPDTIGPGHVETRFDLPAGSGRLYSEGTGIEHTFVNGREIATHGILTGDHPGRLLRSGRDTDTVTIPAATR
ncbi:MAG: amidohydrolase family protein [Acidobacteria bacterium]|nr:amidohydrolase family protein [Acidobacteriota bacterium]